MSHRIVVLFAVAWIAACVHANEAQPADPRTVPTVPRAVLDLPQSSIPPLAPIPQQASIVPHVLIVSIDGLRPDCLLRADAPHIRKLMNLGSFSMWARTTDVAITLPSHVSMLTGVSPERHGISFNADPPEDAKILVPTLFELARQKGLTTAIAAGKRKFSLFTTTGAVDHSWFPIESACDDASVATHAERGRRSRHSHPMPVGI